MIRKLNYFNKSVAFILSMLMFMEIFCLPVFASNINSNINETREEFNVENDSEFVLSNSDVEISDDYIPETAFVSEIESENYELQIEQRSYPEGLSLSATQGDPMVYLTQKWLNQEYGNVSGFGSVPENGKTGWDTVYGLLRALQHELGITSLSNNFGPSTSNLYSQNQLKRQDGVTNRKFAILQGALWCKGYSPGYHLRENADGTVVFDEIFNSEVEQAVIELKKDAGYINPNGTVTLNVMKALMSMDSFKLLSSYGGDVRVREMQQKLNRKYEAYTGLTPCDGVYGRNTNKAIIYALQAEEGLPTSVANGNFGVTTKLCCPQIPYGKSSSSARRYPGTSAGAYYSNSQISALTELLQFALYVNGFGDGVTDGVWDNGVQQAIRAFQKKYAIPQTGVADRTTWLSLFISCGDTDRAAKAADCATILTAPTAKSLYDNGYRYIGRYLTGTYNGGISKAITREEANIIFDAGLNFFPIYQTSARSNAYFTEKQGTEDAKAAIEAATKLGIPQGTIIYFAVDFDCMDYEITSNIIPYFKKVNETMAKSIYHTGIYGTRNACIRVSNEGYACSSFVGDMSTGFSGNLGFSMPNNWAFDQFQTTTIGSGTGRLEIDKDGFSGRDYGVSKLNETTPNINASSINFGESTSTTLEGPTVNILGNDVPLFKFDIGFNSPIDNDIFEINYNPLDETYEITIGFYQSEADSSLKTEEYAEIKEMINAFGGKTSTTTWNNFQKMRSKLKKKNLKFGFDFNSQIAGYLKIDAKSKELKLVESGLLIMADATPSLSYPLAPCIYLKGEFKGTLEAGLNFVIKESGEISPNGKVSFSLTPRVGIEANALIASAYAGFSGTLDCGINLPCNSMEECFEAKINAAVFLELNALVWEQTYNFEFPDITLYPKNKSKSMFSVSNNDLEFIEPINKNINTFSMNHSSVFSENMPVYCLPQIINLGNDKMFMAYIDDSSNRTDKNRTTLMYSFYDGDSWSEPQKVLDDCTADFQPSLYPDGNGGAHVVWQNANVEFDSDVTIYEMSSNIDLFYAHFDGIRINKSYKITDDNLRYECFHRIISNGEDFSVVWAENSENDPFMFNGFNSIHRKQFKNGVLQDSEIVASNLNIINSIDTAYINDINTIVYSVKTTDDTSSIDDMELFYALGAGTNPVLVTNNNEADFSVSMLGDELYWINNGKIYSMNGIATPCTVVENLSPDVSKIKAIQNEEGTKKALIWTQIEETETKFYASYFSDYLNSFSSPQPITTGDDVVRNWDACMTSSGQVELIYCAADNLDSPSANKPYGQINLIQKAGEEYYDIFVNSSASYEGQLDIEQDITINVDVYNTGSKPINKFNVNIVDEEDNIIQTNIINQNLPIGENTRLQIPFTLPNTIQKTEYKLEVLPYDENHILSNSNTATFTIGYSDLFIKQIDEIRTENGRCLEITIENQGFDSVDSSTLKIFENGLNGILVDSQSIPNLNPNEEVKFYYSIAENDLDTSTPDNLYSISVESEAIESNYGNNMKNIYVYSDILVEVNSGVGGTVEGVGKYEYNSSVTLIPKPNKGYIFDGWYENGKSVDTLSSEYTFNIQNNRLLEARFKPNNLQITNLEIFGNLSVGQEITFTATAFGGNQPYQWSFNIYHENELCYQGNSSYINFIEWSPQESGDYIIEITVTDEEDFSTTYEKHFSVN